MLIGSTDYSEILRLVIDIADLTNIKFPKIFCMNGAEKLKLSQKKSLKSLLQMIKKLANLNISEIAKSY